MTMTEKKVITEKNNAIKEDYRILKLEFWTYLDGLTRGNISVKDHMRNFFKHLEDMVFEEDVSINDLSKL